MDVTFVPACRDYIYSGAPVYAGYDGLIDIIPSGIANAAQRGKNKQVD
ncbi:MAG: hypothetical protein JXA03_16120 [Bacteroidales bacterium]|nr:hypothetical protein [Bacteroidales bacterium]